MGSWIDEETAACGLGDVRLNRRLGLMLAAMGDRPGRSLPTAFQDWANTKAAYRFLSNEKVSEDRILAGHLQASALRVQATDGPILVLQDTTEFSFTQAAPERIGFTRTSTGRQEKDGRFRQHTLCGLLLHAILAVTPDGLPLGLTAVKFWSRDRFKGTAALKRKVNDPRADRPQGERPLARQSPPVHRADRRAGALHPHRRPRERYPRALLPGPRVGYELPGSRLRRPPGRERRHLHRAGDEGRRPQRHAQDQLSRCLWSGPGGPPVGEVRDDDGPATDREAEALPASAASDHPCRGDRSAGWAAAVALEAGHQPRGDDARRAVRMPGRSARRWSIETFFKTLKTGCRVEAVRPTTANRLANCIALCGVVAWRIHWMTMLRRGHPEKPPQAPCSPPWSSNSSTGPRPPPPRASPAISTST
jgi:hypothetical protein